MAGNIFEGVDRWWTKLRVENSLRVGSAALHVLAIDSSFMRVRRFGRIFPLMERWETYKEESGQELWQWKDEDDIYFFIYTPVSAASLARKKNRPKLVAIHPRCYSGRIFILPNITTH